MVRKKLYRKLPKVIVHNSVSLDGSLSGFEPNMGLHYKIAARYKPDAHLIGSNTMKVGLEMYGNGIPAEKKSDFKKPKKSNSLPYWVIPDTRGGLIGLLHTFRRFEFCRDIVVLVSQKTPGRYIEYLRERDYDYHVVGEEHVELKKSLLLLAKKYTMKTILADTGRILSSLLLDQGFVSEISLLVHPIIVGEKSYSIFGDVYSSRSLKLMKCRRIEKNYVWLVFTLTD